MAVNSNQTAPCFTHRGKTYYYFAALSVEKRLSKSLKNFSEKMGRVENWRSTFRFSVASAIPFGDHASVRLAVGLFPAPPHQIPPMAGLSNHLLPEAFTAWVHGAVVGIL
jgi:hypothetical protein